MSPRTITGWDCGRGGGPVADLLPCDPVEILLARAEETYDGGEASQTVVLDLWGLDPRLTVAVAFNRVPSPNRSHDESPNWIGAAITANVLHRSHGAIVVGAALDATQLFNNNGQLDGTCDDGCELTSAAEGVRFTVLAIRTGMTTVDIVATVQARPNVALVCPDLLLALRESLRVSLPVPIRFAPTEEE
jgi:hypothetical protein